MAQLAHAFTRTPPSEIRPSATRPCRTISCCAKPAESRSSRRDLILGTAAIYSASSTLEQAQAAEAAFTGKVYLDIGLCPQGLRTDRTIGDTTALCFEPRPLGRLTIGLYGDTAPGTVATFTELIRRGSYVNTTFYRVYPGRFVAAGRQGSKRLGEVEAMRLEDLPVNPDVVSSKAFSRSHLFPGTVSWTVNDEDTGSSSSTIGGRGTENTEFLITTGPGPALDLDSSGIVFGQVVDGFEVLRDIVAVPTIRPSKQLEGFNELAQLFGDERALKARARWGKPLQAVVITGAGMI